MVEYFNDKMNDVSELKIGDGKLLPKFEWSGWIKLIFNKSINFIWRW